MRAGVSVLDLRQRAGSYRVFDSSLRHWLSNNRYAAAEASGEPDEDLRMHPSDPYGLPFNPWRLGAAS
jgi:hypothetical protein